MQTFLDTCKQLGLDQISERGKKLRASIRAQLNETLLFLICGYDFICNASDVKFRGIEQIFVRRTAPLELNLYGNCIAECNRTLTNPGISASIEGTSWKDKPGQKVNFNPALMNKPAGVRAGGAGNYNLQTKALEVLVTHAEGLDKDGALTLEILPKLKSAFATPVGPMTQFQKDRADETLAAMRQALMPYWGAGMAILGL